MVNVFGMPDSWSGQNFEILAKPDVCSNNMVQGSNLEGIHIVMGSNPI